MADIKIAKLSDFRFDDENANKGTPRGKELLKKSLKQRKFARPTFAAADGTILGGNKTLEAAQEVGMEDAIVIESDGTKPIIHVRTDIPNSKTPAARKLALEDNRIAELSLSWDDEILGAFAKFDETLLEELWDENEILQKMNGAGHVTEESGDAEELVDKAEELNEEWKVQTGDLWQLGDHFLLCGDSTKRDDVDKLNKIGGGDAAHLMVTDPPYGVEYDPDWRNQVDRKNGKPYGASAIGLVANDDKIDWQECWKLFSGDVAYIWHAGKFSSDVQISLEKAGFCVRSQIIWNKTRFVISRGDYHWQHEPCWYVVRKGRNGHWAGDRSQTTIWEIEHNKSETGHGTQKPIECMARPIRNNSVAGDSVYDPFGGSGTTLIACEQLGRKCRMIEIEPKYCAVILQRWSDLTGRKPAKIG